jgi:uncharacterized protein YqfA (UPF0365 family)
MDIPTIFLLALVPEILFLLFLVWYLRLGLIAKGIEAKFAVNPIMLVKLRMSKIDPELIILNAIRLVKAGVDLQLSQPEDLLAMFEAHHLCGGNVARVTAALLEAQKRGEPLTLKQALAIDLESTNKNPA